MCPPGHHHNGFMATHALGHMMYGVQLQINCVTFIFIHGYIYC